MKACLSFILAAGVITAQTPSAQPTILNARLETKAFSGSLANELRSTPPAWYAYAIQAPRKNGGGCCWDGASRMACTLEPGTRSTALGSNSNTAQPVHLEETNSAAVLVRVEDDRVDKIRVFSSDCALDAGGLRVVWLNAVPSTASLSFLQGLASGNETRLQNAAIFAISQHDGAQALDLLLQDAKSGQSAHERSQALFWLAQRAGATASAAITDAITNDPDTHVKKQAVFALSQLPHDDGVPKLIEVARTQKNPEVRKQAFFWLGQSQDPRALRFFEEVLGK